MIADTDSRAGVLPEPSPSPTNAPRYFAWLYSPPNAQRLLQILLALEAEIRGVLKPGMEHHVAHVRMEWWRAEIERFARGTPVHPLTRALLAATSTEAERIAGGASAHPSTRGMPEATSAEGDRVASSTPAHPSARAVPKATSAEGERFSSDTQTRPSTRRLLEAAKNASVNADAPTSANGTRPTNAQRLPDAQYDAQPARAHPPNLSGLVDTAIWDMASATFGSRAEIAGYCERWAIAMIEPIMDVATVSARRRPVNASGSAPPMPAYARALGSTIREVELLCDLEADALAGRLRLPLDELERDDVDPESLAKPPWPAKLCALLTARHRALRSNLASGVASVPREDQPALRGLLVWAALAYRRSLLAEHALPQRPELPRFAQLKEVWVAWRAARHASRGAFELNQESTT